MPDVTTGRSESELPALGICFEEFRYPHPVSFLPVHNDLQALAMGYMDVSPESEPNGKTVVLMHGKAFGGYYFEHVIEALTATGYRVVVPDQIGWGKSSKPDIHYSFQLLAVNTADLLDHLGVGEVAVLGHSTGGMTATRFALMYPNRTTWPDSGTSSRSPRRPHVTSPTRYAWLSRNAATSRTSSIQLAFSTPSCPSWRVDPTRKDEHRCPPIPM
jgi:pimeloyl-ACP methyl ester carboxylesterase